MLPEMSVQNVPWAVLYGNNECVKSKYDCHKGKQGMRENMSSKIDQLMQRTPTRQVDESDLPGRQSSC